jgi:hypothetical protein
MRGSGRIGVAADRAAHEPSHSSVSRPIGEHPLRAVEGEVLRPESCDAEVAAMMERLSKLQTWLVMQCCQRNGDPAFRAAMGLIQDVRVLIVERCFK